MNRLMTMILRRFLNKAVIPGMTSGMDRMSGPQKRQHGSKQQKEAMTRARQSMKVMRRVSRF